MGAAALSLLRHLQSARLPRSDLPNLSRLQPRACTSWLLCSQQRGVTKFCQINANDVLDFCDRRNAVSFSLLHRTKSRSVFEDRVWRGQVGAVPPVEGDQYLSQVCQ
jgi:hypothetical protein